MRISRRKIKKILIILNEIFSLLSTIFICFFTFLTKILVVIFKIFKKIYLYFTITYSFKPCKDYDYLLNNLTPRQFEILCSEMFKYLGYKVELTAQTNDYGRDIILYKNGETTFVECKYYKNELIGREICQKLLGSMYMFKADKGVVITTSKFHKNAYIVQNMIGSNKLTFIDRDAIVGCLSKIHPTNINKIIFRINSNA